MSASYKWFAPDGELLAEFASHQDGIRYLEMIVGHYHSHSYLAQSHAEQWCRFGVSPFVQWESMDVAVGGKKEG